jgi:4-amino-4-deoxy-L-arabinose transferase-like glycosyltransferase
MARGSMLVFLLVLLIQAAFFFYVSQHRLVDDDEGYYLLSSRLVIEHKTPYLDFFYQQAPLLPYVFGAWFKLAGISWVAARVLCALLSTLVGGLIYWHVWRETGKWLAGACAVALFVSSSLVFPWFAIVKTFALAMLFLFPAYMIFARLSRETPGWLVAAAGVLFALSADTRSYIVGLLPVFLWWLWRQDAERSLPRVAWFLAGMVVGALPSLALFIASPSAFLYNNLGYHAMRSGEGLVGGWKDKVLVIAALLGGAYTGFQLTLTSLVAVGLLVFRKACSGAALLALILGVVLGLICMMPTPASIQYFSMVMPFLTVSAVLSVSEYLAETRSPQTLHRLQVGCAVLVIAFMAFAVPIFRQYLFTGRKVPGIHGAADVPNWTLDRLGEVSQAVNELAQPGEPVASFFPGYIFATHAAPFPGLEDNYGIWVAPLLPQQKRKQYHLITPGDVAKALAQHQPRLVVVCSNQGEWNAALDYKACDAALRASEYKVARKLGDIAVYEWGTR